MPAINPYEGIHWDTVQHVHSFTHSHSYTRSHHDSAYNAGIRHFGPAHYTAGEPYGSRPIYPLEEWFSEPMQPDILAMPTTEHITGSHGHVCTPGSFLATGGHNGNPPGLNMSIEEFVQAVRDSLQYPNGGGFHVNHNVNYKQIDYLRSLDPELFLGMEIYNHKRNAPWYSRFWAQYAGRESYQDYQTVWDRLLSEGKRCWGFANADYSGGIRWDSDDPRYGPARGRSIVLVNEFAEKDILEAYRQGRFYASLDGSALRFKEIVAGANSLFVETEGADRIRVITESGVVASAQGNAIEYDYHPNNVFVRVEAESDVPTFDGKHGDIIWSQPVMLKTEEDLKRERRRKRIRRLAVLF